MGENGKQIDVHTFNNDDITEQSLKNPLLAMEFDGVVQRVEWYGKFILGFSHDKNMQIYNSESKVASKVTYANFLFNNLL